MDDAYRSSIVYINVAEYQKIINDLFNLIKATSKTDKYSPGYNIIINQLKNEIKENANKRYRRFHDVLNIFNTAIVNGGNNLLLLCSIYKLDEISIEIITNYGNLFNLGEVNHRGETALIINIKNKILN